MFRDLKNRETIHRMIKAILFDFDGTIAPTLSCWRKAYERVFLDHGIQFSNDGLSRYLFCNEERLDDQNAENVPGFSDRVYEFVTPCILTTPVTPLLIETILTAQSLRFGIASNSRSALVKEYLRIHHIEEYFKIVVGAEGDIPCKPDPAMLHIAMNALEVTATETLFVGDALTDMAAGRNAGVETLLFKHPQNDAFNNFCEKRRDQSNNIVSFDQLSTHGYV